MKYNLKSIWFWWIFLSIIYTILYFIFLSNSTSPTMGGYIAGFIGLFVPFGPLSLLSTFVLFPFSILSFIFFFFFANMFQKWFSKSNLNYPASILIILFILGVLTFYVDIIRGTYLGSWKIFINGYYSENNLQ